MNITLEVLIHSALSALTILGITNFANNVFVGIYIVLFIYVEMYTVMPDPVFLISIHMIQVHYNFMLQ